MVQLTAMHDIHTTITIISIIIMIIILHGPAHFYRQPVTRGSPSRVNDQTGRGPALLSISHGSLHKMQGLQRNRPPRPAVECAHGCGVLQGMECEGPLLRLTCTFDYHFCR